MYNVQTYQSRLCKIFVSMGKYEEKRVGSFKGENEFIDCMMYCKEILGSREESEDVSFLIFSHIRMMG